MATSTIKSGVTKGSNVQRTVIDKNMSSSNPQQIQIVVDGYMLFVNDTGITLYDRTAGTTVHKVNWDT